ncbi:MAG: hypothetical protein ABH846_01160 [Patescibacteria group bacterium]
MFPEYLSEINEAGSEFDQEVDSGASDENPELNQEKKRDLEPPRGGEGGRMW